LAALARTVAAGLAARDIGAGSAVVIVTRPGPAFVAALFGTLRRFVDDEHLARRPDDGRVVDVVEQRQPAGHDPGGDADPRGELLGLAPAMRGGEHLAPGGGDDVGQGADGFGLACPGRANDGANQVAAGQQPAHQVDLLGGQRRAHRGECCRLALGALTIFAFRGTRVIQPLLARLRNAGDPPRAGSRQRGHRAVRASTLPGGVRCRRRDREGGEMGADVVDFHLVR